MEGALSRSVADNFRDIIFAPRATFEDVAERPRWALPLVILAAVLLAMSFFNLPMVEELQRIAIAGDPRLSESQREQAFGQLAMWKWVGVVAAPIVYGVVTAFMGLLLWGWSAIAGAKNAEYPIAFTALVYASAVTVLQVVLQAFVIAIKGAEVVAREGGPPLFGLSLFIDRGDMPALLWGQLANINFFSIWYSVLVALAAVHALKASRGAAYALGVAVFVISGFLTALGPS
jgi:hypothetical protein